MRRRDPDSDMGAFMRNQDLPGGQGEVKGFFAKGGFLKPQKELEASPQQRLRLLLALQQLRRDDELQAANDQAQEALLSSLPRYSRYCPTRRVELDAESAEYKYLHKRFVESVVRHKRRRAEPHRAPPQLEVHRIEVGRGVIVTARRGRPHHVHLLIQRRWKRHHDVTGVAPKAERERRSQNILLVDRNNGVQVISPLQDLLCDFADEHGVGAIPAPPRSPASRLGGQPSFRALAGR